ncbi:MAG: DUF4432 family protein [Lentisphaeria bacterium]|nr:DUF4432 family protein [Lentisphaeria bacterium]
MKLEKGFLKERLGSMQQLAAIRRTVLQEGKGRDLRCAEVNNGSGLCFNVYPDRGMDIGEANFKGIPLAWITTGGAANPAFYEPENINWLRSWGGGLLTGCGLSNVGGPGEANGDTHGLHGRLSHSPAKEFNTDCSWNSDGLYTLTISGKVVQSRVFGEKFLLHRTISTALGENSITICDKIENLGFNTEPFMLLYHMNFDYPLIDDGTTLEIPEHKVTPQNDIAAAGINEWQHATAPQPGFTEQVFYHDIPADDAPPTLHQAVNVVAVTDAHHVVSSAGAAASSAFFFRMDRMASAKVTSAGSVILMFSREQATIFTGTRMYSAMELSSVASTSSSRQT